jgi:DNA-binding MarR family transcriptional regulator
LIALTQWAWLDCGRCTAGQFHDLGGDLLLPEMATSEMPDPLAGLLRITIVELVRRDGPDLTARQLSVFLICYLETEAQTVRGLASQLNVSKPAITRALDRLAEFDLVRRKDDPLDRRSVLVQRTATGMAFLRELRRTLSDAATTLEISVDPAQTPSTGCGPVSTMRL